MEEQIEDLAKERLRQQKQIERNASTFVYQYFRNRSYLVQRAIIEAYLKIVRDKILF